MHLISQVQATAIGQGSGMASTTWVSGNKIQWSKIVSTIAGSLFSLAAVACLIFIIWGGIMIITSGGDKGKLEAGRNRAMFAVIGLVVVGSSYAIWYMVLSAMGITSLNWGF